MPNVLEGDFTFTGNLYGNITPGPSTVGDGQVRPDANVAYTKHQRKVTAFRALTDHATAATVTRVGLHRVTATNGGSLLSFGVYASVAAAGGSATVDLLVNGVSVLAAPFVIDAGDAAYVLVEGTVTDAPLALGDCVEVSVTAVSATAPKGLCAVATLYENAL